MSTLDEITKEKQWIGEALAQVDAQREKLTGQLGELEAAERVLARYSKKARRQERLPQPRRRPPRRRRLLHRDQGARALGPNNQLPASPPHPPLATRCLLWHMARRSRKSPLHARELARTMSAPPSPGTSGLAASKSATGSSTPRRRACTHLRLISYSKRASARPPGVRPAPARRAASYGPSDAGYCCLVVLFERVVVVPPSGSVIVVVW